ncbi:MAG: hypothetical protein AB7U43_02405 [Desulfobacter sp.]
MGQRIHLEIPSFNELGIEIDTAVSFYDDFFHQCWSISLKLWWQTMSIQGYAFLSSRWHEVIFQKVYDGQAPHFISGRPIETLCENDMLSEFAYEIGADPGDLVAAIFSAFESVTFVFPPMRLAGEDVLTSTAAYCYQDTICKIRIAL